MLDNIICGLKWTIWFLVLNHITLTTSNLLILLMLIIYGFIDQSWQEPLLLCCNKVSYFVATMINYVQRSHDQYQSWKFDGRSMESFEWTNFYNFLPDSLGSDNAPLSKDNLFLRCWTNPIFIFITCLICSKFWGSNGQSIIAVLLASVHSLSSSNPYFLHYP